MNRQIVIKLCVITGILCPVWLPVLLIPYLHWSKNPNHTNERKLTNRIRITLYLLFIEILLISFFLFQYGRLFVHVIGTFY